jgi:hypothetical protein
MHLEAVAVLKPNLPTGPIDGVQPITMKHSTLRGELGARRRLALEYLQSPAAIPPNIDNTPRSGCLPTVSELSCRSRRVSSSQLPGSVQDVLTTFESRGVQSQHLFSQEVLACRAETSNSHRHLTCRCSELDEGDFSYPQLRTARGTRGRS